MSLAYNPLVQTILLILPEWIANGSPPVISKIVKNVHPIDFGRNFIDGKRLLGDGKTFEGYIGGVLSGYALTLIVYIILAIAYPNIFTVYIIPSPLDVFVLCNLALLGDMLGAFIKRRLGLPRGAPAPVLDQLDFMIFPMLYMYYVLHVSDVVVYAIMVLLTVGTHYFTNFVAYKLRIKREPW